MSAPIGPLSLSGSYTVRWSGVSYSLLGAPTDPRGLFVVQFQLIVPGATAFGTWVPGTWEGGGTPPVGPYAADIEIGAGQPAGVNPGEPGTYFLKAQYAGASESPIFQCGIVTFEAP